MQQSPVDVVRHFAAMNMTDFPIAGICVPKISLTDRKMSASDFDKSIVCHVEIFIFAADVFRVPIEEHSFYHTRHAKPGDYHFGQNDRIPVPVDMLSRERLAMFRNNKVRRNRAT